MPKKRVANKTVNFTEYGRGGARCRREGFTRHAQDRFQQRGLSQARIDVVLEFGKMRLRKRADGRESAYVYYMDKRARENAARAWGKDYKRIADKLDIYIVESCDTGEIITIAHRWQRLKW